MRRVLVIASLAAGALMLLAPTAQALVEEEFTSTGEHEFTVPAGVHKIGGRAIGGTGGAASTVSGGEAAQVTSYLNVTPGETLYVEVGGNGQSQEEGGEGGFNGGGDGGGGGGGASDIRLEPRSTPLSTEDTRLIVAAGGGGAGSFGETAGTAGGNAGEPGEDGEYPGGEPGTETEGGAGSFGCELVGQGGNGELGQGGSGGNSEFFTGPGGGGGGGLYGGGGGGGACIVGSSGGGGGSSLLPGGGLVTLTTEPPLVEIVYAKPPTITITSPTAGATVTQGQALTASYECSSPDAPPIPIAECEGSVPDGAALDTSTLGPHTLTVEAEDLAENTASASVSYTVIAPPPPPTPKSSNPPPALPDTTITAKPKKTVKTKKKKAKVKFSFSSDLAGATFECKLDKGSFAPCTSPKTYKVKKGKHTFSVEAVGPAGTDPTPATFSFKVKKKK
jgi:Glycine rich protein